MKNEILRGLPTSGEMINKVKFTGDFSVKKCGELSKKLQLAMYDCPDLTIDLSEVSKIDLAGLQLICSTHRSAMELGISVRLSSPLPPHIAEFAQKAGIPRSVSCTFKDDEGNFCMWRELV